VYKKFWRCIALPSALVSVWRVLKNKIITRVNVVGWSRSLVVICFVGAEYLDSFGVNAMLGLE